MDLEASWYILIITKERLLTITKEKMTNKIMEQIAETAVYDYGDETEIENKYEKYRDDQRNTGIIAALVGGFALSNSWNMNIYGHTDTENLTNVELGSYTLAVLAVHGCTCSALASAFLYKSITSVKSPKAGVAWVERHPVLVQLPWYKFVFGTAAYVVSVILVAWTTLQFNLVSRILTLVGGLCGCSIVIYTCFIVMYVDACECEEHDNEQQQQHRRTAGVSTSTMDSDTSLSLKKIQQL